MAQPRVESSRVGTSRERKRKRQEGCGRFAKPRPGEPIGHHTARFVGWRGRHALLVELNRATPARIAFLAPKSAIDWLLLIF